MCCAVAYLPAVASRASGVGAGGGGGFARLIGLCRGGWHLGVGAGRRLLLCLK